jgi:hypothetical protein
MVERAATLALVTPLNWLAQDRYEKFRISMLNDAEWNLALVLGAGAFDAISGEVVKPQLFISTSRKPPDGHHFHGQDVASLPGVAQKREAARTSPLATLRQRDFLHTPKRRITITAERVTTRLLDAAYYVNGIQTGDSPRFTLQFWELRCVSGGWATKQTTVEETTSYGGMTQVVYWQDGEGVLAAFVREKLDSESTGAWLRGREAWGKRGVLVSAMGSLQVSLYLGDLFDDNTVAIIPRDPAALPAIWSLCSVDSYHDSVRDIDKALKVRGPLVEVDFDPSEWGARAARDFPNGVPAPDSFDPTQWLFNGHPKGSDNPLHVGVARLVGYQWPRQTGSEFPDCPALGPDGLEKHADADGIVCLSSVRGEPSAADRLIGLLAEAYGPDWSGDVLAKLLADADAAGKSLDDWLRDLFFEQHVALFHQRPFVWHVWDGLRDGFNALVNYHRLAGPDGQGSRTLQKLTFEYLGDWISRQKAAYERGEEGAEARLTAATHLQEQLKKIIEGEPPFDIFVRWKPLPEQPIGWHPDINDGVRVNIRPFMTARPLGARAKAACILRTPPRISWDKDRGKEPDRPKADFPWFWKWDESTADFAGGAEFDGCRHNDLHYSRACKEKARETASGAAPGASKAKVIA